MTTFASYLPFHLTYYTVPGTCSSTADREFALTERCPVSSTYSITHSPIHSLNHSLVAIVWLVPTALVTSGASILRVCSESFFDRKRAYCGRSLFCVFDVVCLHVVSASFLAVPMIFAPLFVLCMCRLAPASKWSASRRRRARSNCAVLVP